jgi:hypothetical protein
MNATTTEAVPILAFLDLRYHWKDAQTQLFVQVALGKLHGKIVLSLIVLF